MIVLEFHIVILIEDVVLLVQFVIELVVDDDFAWRVLKYNSSSIYFVVVYDTIENKLE